MVNLRSWLRRTPQPAYVLVDGRKVPMGTGSRRWAELESTIQAIGGERLEAIGADGELLRATQLDATAPELDASSAAVHTARPASGMTHEALLGQFAQLISAAYQQGATATRESYAIAFTENTALVKLLANRLGSLEVAWQRAMTQTAQLQAEVAQGSTGEDSVLSLLGPALAAANAAASNGKPRA